LIKDAEKVPEVQVMAGLSALEAEPRVWQQHSIIMIGGTPSAISSQTFIHDCP
jgi:hypothetical protein